MSIYKQTTVADFEKIMQELQGRFRGCSIPKLIEKRFVLGC